MVVNSTDDLESCHYLFYRLVQRMESFDEPNQISKTRLYKFSCETDHYLQHEMGVEITFPRYWYQFGEVPHIDVFKLDFLLWEDSNGYDVVSLAKEANEGSFDIHEEVRDQINKAVTYIVRKLQEYDTPEVVDYHYSHRAPREFVRKYHSLRKRLDDADLEQGTFARFNIGSSDATDTKEQLRQELEQLVIAYPDLYSSMEKAFLEWEDTMQILIQEGELEKAQELESEFWQALSRAELRIQHNKDVSESQIDAWKNQRQDVIDNILREIRDDRSTALQGSEFEGELQEKEVVDEVVSLFGRSGNGSSDME